MRVGVCFALVCELLIFAVCAVDVACLGGL